MFNLSNKAYDRVKDAVTLWSPAAATLYTTLASIWNWGYIPQVVGSIVAVTTFAGVVLKIETTKFQEQHTIVPWTPETGPILPPERPS